ncbi:MAG TPA: hypothetical protein VK009_18860 [Chloroflexota bacterium]|nr:hypothetical protein [Chloroflexota bacterium]
MSARSRYTRYHLAHLTDWLEQLDEATTTRYADELRELEPGIWLSELPRSGWELARWSAVAPDSRQPSFPSVTQ